MKKIFELNEDDITKIVADSFEVDVNDIKISYELPTIDTEIFKSIVPSIKMQIETECDALDIFNR